MQLESKSYKKIQVHQDLWILDDFPDVTLVTEDAHPAICLALPHLPHHPPCGGGGCRGTPGPHKGPLGPSRAPQGPPGAPKYQPLEVPPLGPQGTPKDPQGAPHGAPEGPWGPSNLFASFMPMLHLLIT